MEKEDIRIGGKYLLPVTVTTIEKSGFLEVETIHDYSYRLAPSEVKTILSREASAFPHINPYPPLNLPIMTEIPETYPKYDPCRKFKEGDIVSPRFWCKRPPSAYYISDVSGHFTPEDGAYEVEKDELPDSTVLVKYKGKIISMQACHLELMTPVEEREPFKVYKCDDNEYVVIFKGTRVSVYPFKGEGYPYYYTQDGALARAEAECKRLNEEYRKEMK